MSTYKIEVNNKEFSVKLLARTSTELTFEIEGKTYTVNMSQVASAQPMQSIAQVPQPIAAPPKTRAARSGDILAPMPGIVVNTLVQPGQNVAAGETLLVVEAMKMENNIPAPREGRIRELHVKKGQEINMQQLLVSLE